MNVNVSDFPLLLSATISPAVSQISVCDPFEREEQYIETLKFYTSIPTIKKIIFVENSGWDLSRLRSRVNGSEKIEWLSAPKTNFPAQLIEYSKKSYGEMRLMDFAFDHSEFLKDYSGFFKATGRFKVLNIEKLIREASRRDIKKRWDCFCDTKDHCVYSLLGLKWPGHNADTRFFGLKKTFYTTCLYNQADTLVNGPITDIEGFLFSAVKKNIISRFYTEPEYTGKAGHIQTSIINANDYSGNIAILKRKIRQFGRWFFPWFKF